MTNLTKQFRFPDDDESDPEGSGSTSGGGSGDIIKPPGGNQPDTTEKA